MDATAIAAFVALGVALIGSAGTFFSKKVRAPEDRATERRDTIADRDGLIGKLNERIDDLEVRVASTEDIVRAVRDHNNALIAFCYKVIAIVRRHGHEDEIPTDKPEGIHL